MIMAAERVNHPAHYNAGGIECIDALEAATIGLEGIEAFCTANAIKYLWRWKRKNGEEDLQKAIWYINKIIDRAGEPRQLLTHSLKRGSRNTKATARRSTIPLYRI